MPDAGGVSFGRVRVPVGEREILLEWEDRPDGWSPFPFTVWTVVGSGGAAALTATFVTKADIVGWRRAPDPVKPQVLDAPGAGASAPGPGGDQG